MTMNWDELQKTVKAGSCPQVLLLSGEEEEIKRRLLLQIRELLLPPGLEAMNETVIEGGTARQIIEAASTLPFMAEKRLTVTKDFPPLLSAKSRDEAGQTQEILDFLSGIPAESVLVFFVRGEADGRKKLTQQLQKEFCRVNCGYLDEEKLVRWAAGEAARLNASIGPEAARLLIFLAGQDLTRLMGEMEKLAAYAGPGGAIGEDAVRRLVPPNLEATVFQVVDEAVAGHTAKAQTLLRAALLSGETRIGILAMLERQAKTLTDCALLQEKGLRLSEIEKALSLSRYAAQRTDRTARALGAKRAEAAFRLLVAADYDIKSGRLRDEAALDAAIFRLSKKE